MRLLDFGGITVSLAFDADISPTLSRFLDRATNSSPDRSVDLAMTVDCGEPRLVLDTENRAVALTLLSREQSRPDGHTAQIAVLQAAARCLGLVAGPNRHLLHGGAIDVPGVGAVAVLDGGRGQGKTSLALGLALDTSGGLIVDEFLFVRDGRAAMTTGSAPRLPWHVRADMAPQLTPTRRNDRLVFPGDLQATFISGREAAEVVVLLVPTTGLDAGQVAAVHPLAVKALLRYAVSDHLAKLLDPRLDHVSVFSSSDQLVTADGQTLATRYAARTRIAPVLLGLSRLPTFLVGIGAPSDIHLSVSAARKALEEQR